MRSRAAALLLAPVAGCGVVAAAFLVDPPSASAQQPATLRLSVSPELTRQMEEAPGELAWPELPSQLTVEFTTSGDLGLPRAPIRLVAVAVQDGGVVGEASTSPSLIAAGESAPASDLAGSDWPPAGDWFPAGAWRPDGIAATDPVAPNSEAAASQIALPSNAGGVVLYAAPAAEALVERFVTVPVVVTTWPVKEAGTTDTAASDSTGG